MQAVYLTAFYNMLVLGAVAFFFIVFPNQIVGAFTSDAIVASYSVNCLRIVAYGNLAYAIGMVMVQAFNGAGDTVTPTLINIVGFWCCEIPLAWTLAFRAHLQVRGVFIAIPCAEALITVMGVSMFLLGRWKKRVI